MDERDKTLLNLLTEDSRISIAALARQVNLSPTAVRQRLARLEKEGEIQGYTILRKSSLAEHDRTSAYNNIEAILMLRLTGPHCHLIKKAFAHRLEITQFWSLAGEVDACLKVKVDGVSQLTALSQEFADNDYVEKIHTHLIINTQLNRSV